MHIRHIGSNSFTASHIPHTFSLRDILHVPHATKNLLSISKFTQDNNIILQFDSVSCQIKDKTSGQVLLRGTLTNGLYKLDITHSDSKKDSSSFSSQPSSSVSAYALNATTTSNPVHPKSNTSQVWHCRLGHPSPQVLRNVLSIVNPSIRCNESFFCEACQIGKLHHIVYKPSNNKTSNAFDLIYTDVWGPSFHSSIDGYKYYLSYIYTYIYIICRN